MAEETQGDGARGATQRLKDLTSQALSRDAVRSAFGTKLVAGGLGLCGCAAGVDYFATGDEVQKAIGKLAAGSSAAAVADTVMTVGAWLSAAKAWVAARLPDTPQEVVAALASLLGALLLAWGLALKVRTPGVDRGRGLRDVGSVLLGPGVVGLVLFGFKSWAGVPALRVASRSFVEAWQDGRTTWKGLFDYIVRYTPWAWREVGAVLLLGLALLVAWIVGLAVTRGRERSLMAQLATRAAGAGAALCLTYFAIASAIAVMTYGGGLACVVWAWKVKPMAFLATVGFMALGVALRRTGKAVLAAHASVGPIDGGPDEAAAAVAAKHGTTPRR